MNSAAQSLTPASGELLPRILDRYELLSVLGSGSFATVYQARHVHTRQMVAVKVLRVSADAPFEIERWLVEARATAAVNHPNVVRVLDSGRAATGEAFLVMELAPGRTLDALLDARAVSPADALRYSLEILEGLEAAHRRGVVHRDVKPPNVLVTVDPSGTSRAKLIDFGVSKVAMTRPGAGTLPGTAIGTPGYMAPELFGDAANADGRVDVYAVGAMLYLMLAGRLPFPGPTYEDFVVQVRTQRAPPLASIAPHVPPLLAAIVDRSLARDRDARWPSARAFADAIQSATAPGPRSLPPALEQTMDARALTTGEVLPPSTSGVRPRTAPPPPRDSGVGLRFWFLGGLGLFLVGALIAAAMRVLVGKAIEETERQPREPKTPNADTRNVDRVTAIHGIDDDDVDPVDSATPPPHGPAPNVATPIPLSTKPTPTATAKPPLTTTATATATTAAPAAHGDVTGNGVHFTVASNTGDHSAPGAIAAFVRAASPKLSGCRGATPITVTVSFMFHSDVGTIAQVHTAPRGTDTASCVDQAFTDAGNQGARLVGGGILDLRVTLDPR